MRNESIEVETVDEGMINKSTVVDVSDRSFITGSVVGHSAANIQKQVRQPSGDAIVPEFDIND